MIPAELYGGPLCGQPMLVHPDHERIEVTSGATGELVIYELTDIPSRKGCRVFRFIPNQPQSV